MPPKQPSKMKQPSAGINPPPSANAPASTPEESPWGPTTDIPTDIGKNGLTPQDMAGDPSGGWGHLVSAAEAKKWDEVQKIIDMRANLDLQALHPSLCGRSRPCAREMGSMQLVALPLAWPDPSDPSTTASSQRHWQDENGRTALHWACSRGRIAIVTNLIDGKADPNLARRL